MKGITFTVARHDLVAFKPRKMVDDLKAAGFVFENESCPVKIAGAWGNILNGDGSMTFWQSAAAERGKSS